MLAGAWRTPGGTSQPVSSVILYACEMSSILWKNCPEEERGNYDYLVDVVDWEKNVDPNFSKNRFMKPKVITSNEYEKLLKTEE